MTANRVYLDHAATTDILPAAIDAMVQQMRTGGNPSSCMATGRSKLGPLSNTRVNASPKPSAATRLK